MAAKEGFHALKARIFEVCYSKRISEEERDQLYEEICVRLQAIENQFSTNQQMPKERVKVKGFSQE